MHSSDSRDPMDLAAIDPDVRRIATSLSKRLLDQGAKAVLLTGSQARGRARPDSDIDFFVVGDGPEEAHEVVDGRVVSMHWWSPEQARQRMSQPASALIAVFGWRDALVVDDPNGIGVELQAEARNWSWQKIQREADAWAADQLVGLAEYVPKLSGALDDGRLLDVAAIRAELTLRLGEVGAVVHRVTSESENGLWEGIADAGGSEWRTLVERALAAEGEDVRVSAEAAIEFFALLANQLEDALQPPQRAVVQKVLEQVGRRSG